MFLGIYITYSIIGDLERVIFLSVFEGMYYTFCIWNPNVHWYLYQTSITDRVYSLVHDIDESVIC